MRINRPPPRSSNHVALGAAACAIALIAAFGAVWRDTGRQPARRWLARHLRVRLSQPESSAEGAPMTASENASPASAAANGARPLNLQVRAETCSVLRRQPRPTNTKGVVVFAVAPWAEVFVNGARTGTTPPLAQLQLPTGRHTIELRNGQRQPYITEVDVEPGRPLRISHLFQ